MGQQLRKLWGQASQLYYAGTLKVAARANEREEEEGRIDMGRLGAR